MLATFMQGVDTTIANVALPHMQGSMSASQDQIAWVVTSYIVAAAIMTPLTGWLAGRFGVKYVFFISVAGFTLASALVRRRDEPRPAGHIPSACKVYAAPRWCRFRKRCCCRSTRPSATLERWRFGGWGSSSARLSGRHWAAG